MGSNPGRAIIFLFCQRCTWHYRITANPTMCCMKSHWPRVFNTLLISTNLWKEKKRLCLRLLRIINTTWEKQGQRESWTFLLVLQSKRRVGKSLPCTAQQESEQQHSRRPDQHFPRWRRSSLVTFLSTVRRRKGMQVEIQAVGNWNENLTPFYLTLEKKTRRFCCS